MMKRQSRRATLLTLLAAFYLPLTLVTGIFGMNIKEFDVQKPSFSLCFEALFAVIAVTAILYGLYRYLPVIYYLSTQRQNRPRAEESRLRRFCDVFLAPFRLIYLCFLELEERRQGRPREVDLLEDAYKLA
jgi:hypothetical protein